MHFISLCQFFPCKNSTIQCLTYPFYHVNWSSIFEMVAEGEVHIFKPWKTPQITKECRIERLFHSQISHLPLEPKNFIETIGILQIMHVWTFQTLKLRVYTYLGQSLWWFFMQWQKVEMPCASHSLSVWESERDRESCLLTVVIDQKLWALPELFLLMEALVGHPLNIKQGTVMKTLKHSSDGNNVLLKL